MKTHKLLSMVLAVITLLSAITAAPSVGAVKRYNKNGIVYTLDKKGNATVVRLSFTFEQSINKPAIPSKIDGHTVTRLDFEENKNGKITFDIPEKLYIPKTVKYISNNFINYIWSYETYSMSIPYYRFICDRNSYAHKFALKNRLMYIIKGEHKTSGDIERMLKYYPDVTRYGCRLYDKGGKETSLQNFTPMVYTDKARKLKFIIKINDYKLEKSTDYSVKYYYNVAVGTATARIKGRGNYTGKVDIEYKIIPPKHEINSVEKTKENNINVTFSNFENTPDDFLFELQYSTNKKFKNAKSIKGKDGYSNPDITYAKGDMFSFELRNPELGKKYYFRLRNYCNTVYVVGDYKKCTICGQRKICGKWSKVKSITI